MFLRIIGKNILHFTMKLLPISSYVRYMHINYFGILEPRDGIIIEHVTIFGDKPNAYKVFFVHEDDYDIFTTAQMEEEFEILSLGENL